MRLEEEVTFAAIFTGALVSRLQIAGFTIAVRMHRSLLTRWTDPDAGAHSPVRVSTTWITRVHVDCYYGVLCNNFLYNPIWTNALWWQMLQILDLLGLTYTKNFRKIENRFIVNVSHEPYSSGYQEYRPVLAAELRNLCEHYVSRTSSAVCMLQVVSMLIFRRCTECERKLLASYLFDELFISALNTCVLSKVSFFVLSVAYCWIIC